VSAPATVTRVGMAPRAAGLTFEAAQEHWRTEHRDVALGIAGLVGYVQNHAVLCDGLPLLPYPGFDVCAETEFADFDTMRRAFASEHYQQTVRGDEKNLIDGSQFMLALTRRQVLADGQPGENAVKLITLMRTHPASTRERLIDSLLGPHVDAASEARPQRHEVLIPPA
jgi:EthD domain